MSVPPRPSPTLPLRWQLPSSEYGNYLTNTVHSKARAARTIQSKENVAPIGTPRYVRLPVKSFGKEIVTRIKACEMPNKESQNLIRYLIVAKKRPNLDKF
nr:hypothetical protein HmN_000615400 [Hymenolepis microstoma]